MNGKIAFIGGGNMTRAIVAGLRESGFDAAKLVVAEPVREARDALEKQFPGIAVEEDNVRATNGAECVVLAVKPQVLPDVCHSICTAVQSSRPLIVSIAAGIRSDDIEKWLGGNLAVVRVMPNQPALLRKGVSGIYANDKASASDVALARDIMAAVGKVVEVDSEAGIDAVTAVSGSGPAYFYYLIDILTSAGEDLGLEPEAARTLARETARGAALLAAESDDDMDTLISRVRSPGGTTAAALDSLDDAGARDIFAAAIAAACDRAGVLADEAHSQTDRD